MNVIENTGLWRGSLGYNDNIHSAYYDRLKNCFRIFRDRVGILVSRVLQDIPELTIHDLSHLDALWEIADTIAGENYPLTPLEAFIFGGAVLLHDAALCFEAYQGGLDGIRSNTFWSDSYAYEKDRSPNNTEQEWKHAADFVTVRHLHSHRARDLAVAKWTHPNNEDMYLIEDFEIRNDFGEIIGIIASSHHWNTEKLSISLPEQLNAPGYLPRSWGVDPIKIACLLRCADAAHIDSRRAPDFLYALIRRHGVSLQHWQAQNRLSRVGISNLDPKYETLLFTSYNAFPIDQSEAWWVAYDAICLVQHELRSSNNLLASRLGICEKSPPFKMKDVAGVSAPETAIKYLRVSGWSPCSTNVHVSDMHRLITQLGGEQLYGQGCDKLKISVREIIQNSRDAVSARRHVDCEHKGEIKIALEKQNGEWVINVTDDGVGMAKTTMTGPLIDFGNSFWSGNLIIDEFPGLRSSNFRSSGRFGIGFFSVFMAAQRVEVTSRRYDKALDDANQLVFSKGLTLRPILTRSTDGLNARTSTSIKLTISDKLINYDGKILTGGIFGHNDKIPVNFCDYISHIISGIDVNVEVKYENDKIHHISIDELINSNISDIAEWLRRITYSKYIKDLSDEIFVHYAHRLRPVKSDNKVVGFAAINSSLRNICLSVTTIGGLESGRNPNIVGFFDYEPQSAKRDQNPKPIATENEISQWADTQINILIKQQVEKSEMAKATYSFCELNINPERIFYAPFVIQRGGNFVIEFLSLKEIMAHTVSSGIYLYASDEDIWHYCRHDENIRYGENGPTFIPIENCGGFYILERKNPSTDKEYTFLNCLINYLNSNGLRTIIDKGMPIFNNFIGKPISQWKITAS